MKKRLLGFAAGVALVFLLLEALFHLLPVSTATRSGYYVHPLILTYPPHHCFVASTGWDLKNSQLNCANNLGFLADRDFVHNPAAIALIGDSFVEANMLDPKDRLAAQLERSLDGRQIYSLGGPGSSLLDYAERAKFAAHELGIRTFVFFLERGDVKQALCGSGNIHGPCIDSVNLTLRTETQRAPGFLKRIFRESALAQYVFSQLKFDVSSALSRPSKTGSRSEANAGESGLRAVATDLVVQKFIEQLKTIDGARHVLVIDAERENLFGEVKPVFSGLGGLVTSAQADGIAVVDPTPAFREFVSGTGMILEIGPYDRHLNPEGVRVLAEAIAKKLAAGNH